MAEVVLRRAEEADVPRLTEILTEPSVARWWGENDEATVRENLEITFAVLVDGDVAGLVLFAEEADPEYLHVALDISIASDAQGRGIGPEALRQAIRHFAERGHHRFTIDPAAHNAHAISAYEKVGFRPVGVMRQYERFAEDEPWHDGLLMELLVSEL